MIDAPGRAKPRFPPSCEHIVGGALRRAIDELDARVGVSALASGADILFAEALLERGGELHLILPLNVEEFLEQSVRPSGDDRWEERFHAIRGRATREEIIGDDYLRASGTPFQLAALVIDGHAQMEARARQMACSTLGVWDGLAGDGLGGTSSFLGHAVAQGRQAWAIDPVSGQRRRVGGEAVEAAQKLSWRVIKSKDVVIEHRLAAILFADARGFSGLREVQMPAFMRAVLGIIRDAAPPGGPTLVLNTWGDGLYVVTEKPVQAAEIALTLLERAAAMNWKAEGLPDTITFRVGLHAGPVFYTKEDAVLRRPNANGRDVSVGARIEPVVEPGHAWASRTFAVLAAATGCAGFKFTDLGRKPLAKGFGDMHLYGVRRA